MSLHAQQTSTEREWQKACCESRQSFDALGFVKVESTEIKVVTARMVSPNLLSKLSQLHAAATHVLKDILDVHGYNWGGWSCDIYRARGACSRSSDAGYDKFDGVNYVLYGIYNRFGLAG